MKKGLLLFMAFTILCLNSNAQDVLMLTDNPYWIYNYDFDYNENRNNGHSNSTYGIGISVKGEKSIKGKIYKKLYLVALQYDGYSTRSTDNGDANYALALREEGGKVLVDYDEYMNYLRKEFVKNTIIPRGDSLFIPYHKTQEGELVLYDFNMQIGDKYSHIEGYQDISVVDINQIVFEDGKNRKLFTLSNGAKIIEGIGCINSCGLLFDYLNPSKPSYNYDKQHFAYLSQFSNDDTIILYEDIITNIPSAKETSFLVDGRTWNYKMRDIFLDENNWPVLDTLYFSLKIEGDTIFQGVDCKKIYFTENDSTYLFAYAYEENLTTYFYFLKSMKYFCAASDTWVKGFDFNLKIGDKCSSGEYIGDIDTIEVKGTKYTRFWIGIKKNGKIDPCVPMIYSIGGEDRIWGWSTIVVNELPKYSCVSVYDGDKCIFESSDYRKAPISTDNEDVTTDKKSAFLVDGRSWKYYYYHRTYDADYIEKVKKCYYSLTIQGDTIISDRCCKKIYYKEDSIRYNTYDKNYNLTETHLVISDSISLHGFICEEKGSVSFYFLNKLIAAAYIDLGKWIKMYDFNAKSGEQCDWLIYEHGFSQLTKTQENINGIDYPCYLLYGENSQYGNVTVPVIPGIGCNGLYFTPIELSSSTFGGGFLSVYDGKKSIFKSSDYYRLFDKYNTKYAAVRLGTEPMESQFDYDQNHVTHLWVWGKPQAADYEYLRTKRLAELELLDMRDADIDTLQAEAFDITLPESNASPKYIVLPKKLKHISDNALCVYPNITTYEVTGAYPSLGKDVYSRKGKTSNHIFVVPSIDNKYLILHTIDPTGGSSGPGRVPIKRLAMVDDDSIYGSSVMSKGGDTLYYVNASKGKGYAVANGMKTIAANAMENKLLENAFNIPETVDSIGNRVFNGLRIVETRSNALQYYLACYRANPPMIGNEVFDESSLVTGSHVFYVNKESISDYKNTKGWDKLYYGDIDDVSGVEEVKTAEKQSPYYYDLQGRRLINPTKGLYIHNGKKVIVR